MSTRAVIAKPKGDEWVGRYHHSDGYPTGLGQELWGKVSEYGVDAVRRFLIDEHKAGWSSILFADWSHAAGFVGTQGRIAQYEGRAVRPPMCYCHGERAEGAQLYRSRDEKDGETPLFMEWVYVLGQNGLVIFKSVARKGRPLSHGPRYGWDYLTAVPWSDSAPDWDALEARGYALAQAARDAVDTDAAVSR